MLHLTLAANILNAVGGVAEPRLPGDHAVVPDLPRALERGVPGRPLEVLEGGARDVPADRAAGRARRAARGRQLRDDRPVLRGDRGGAEAAWPRELGEAELFCGDPARQVTDALYYGGSGRIIAVTDLASALRALEEIVEQGEGLQHQEIWDGDRDMFHPEREEVAHYFRFNELYVGRRYTLGDTPQSGPTGEPVTVDWDGVWPMRPNPRTADYPDGSPIRAQMEEFKHAYTAVLHLLHESLQRQPAPARGRDRADVRAQGRGREADAARQRRRRDDRRPAVRVGAAASSATSRAAPSRRSSSSRTARTSSTATCRSRARRRSPPRRATRSPGARPRRSRPRTPTRCAAAGMSSSKPFCDGTHARVRLRRHRARRHAADDRADPDRRGLADRGETARRCSRAQGLVVKRDGYLCMHAAFCVGRLKRIPELMEGVDDSDVRAAIIGMMERCPSGSYMYALTPGGEDVEPDYPVGIAVTAGGGRARRVAVGDRRHPALRSDGQPFETRNRGDALPLRPLADEAALRRHAPRDRLPRALRDGRGGRRLAAVARARRRARPVDELSQSCDERATLRAASVNAGACAPLGGTWGSSGARYRRLARHARTR